jgi:FMN reductase [NAD(P)H]
MSNPVIKQMRNRRSVRQFTGEPVSDADLQVIFETAQRAPTSINGQQISLIYTRDKARIAQIAELCGGQPQVRTADVFVAVVIDFNRTAIAVRDGGKTQVIERSAEGIMVGAVDAGIMLSSLQTAAESFGYGTTAIGAVRQNAEAMTELMGLPPKTFVAVGCTIGVPTQAAMDAPLKPRIPLESFVMEGVYDAEMVSGGVKRYEEQFAVFRETQGAALPGYAETVATTYSRVYYRATAKAMEAQGFRFADTA